MDKFWLWYASSPIASWARVFLALVIAAAVGSWALADKISLAEWQTWVIAALVATLPTLTRALNPADAAFGRGAAPDDEG
jgi:hypothetical protein